MNRAVVLGGTGFIGGAIARECESRGLPVLSRGSRDLDLRTAAGTAALRRLLRPGTILFLCSRAAYGPRPWRGFSEDAAMLENAAAALRGSRGAKCVFLSSTAVFGTAESNRRVDEGTPFAAESPYAAAKILGEGLLSACGAPLLILRPPLVYGPGDPSNSYGPGRMIHSLIDRGEIRIFGDGGDERDFLFIDDLAAIAVDLAFGNVEGAFHLSSGEPASFADVARLLLSTAGKGKIVRDARKVAKTAQILDASKLRRALPTARFTVLASGLALAYRAALKR